MSSLKDPSEKKALEYEKDHRYRTHDPHGFRIGIPRAKAGANRIYRRSVREYIQTSMDRIQDDEKNSNPPFQRVPVRKRGAVVSLGVWIKFRMQLRARHTAGKIFRSPYSEDSRQRFSRFLATVTEDDSDMAREIAQYFHELLNPRTILRPTIYINDADKCEWLIRFLADTPEWDQRLRGWIATMLSENDTSAMGTDRFR